jgi:hypothetical protein
MLSDEVLTREWLQAKLEKEKIQAGKAQQERRDARAREDMRAAFKQETGSEPTPSELEKALQEKRRKDVAETARLNEANARRAMHQSF